MNLAPPSEPDWRISRIRLSSQWVLCREGAALRLVPKYGGQTFGITRANCTRLIPPLASPRGHSRWFSFPSFCPLYFHLPASLGSTVVTRFSATTDALTPASQARGLLARRTLQHWRVSLVSSLGLPAIPSPTISVSSGDRPGVRRFGSAPIARSTGFVFRSQTRPSTPTESSSRRRPSRVTCVTDWSFFPLLRDCSPPRLAATQLRFDTARLFTAQRRTSTALSQRHPRRTSADVSSAGWICPSQCGELAGRQRSQDGEKRWRGGMRSSFHQLLLPVHQFRGVLVPVPR